MNKLMLSCLKASELIEKRNYSPLTIADKIQLSVHLSMCTACKTYEKQSILIDKAIKIIEANAINGSELEKSENKILSAIKDKIDKE